MDVIGERIKFLLKIRIFEEFGEGEVDVRPQYVLCLTPDHVGMSLCNGEILRKKITTYTFEDKRDKRLGERKRQVEKEEGR